MFRGIVFRDEVEELVQFVEETDPSEIIEVGRWISSGRERRQ